VKPLTPQELEAKLRAIGAQRYHRLHPFHALLHGGKCTKGQVQAWALNRYYYHAMIPRCAGNGAAASSTTTARAKATAASRAGSS
jgi:pyrroloquinoline-quinone synthase